MKMIKVESSNVDAVGYENAVLVVRFVNGSVYSYSDVPEEVYDSMLNAESKGKYLCQKIKGKYDYCRLSD